MNVRSIKPKTAPFSEYVTSKNLDIVAVTKTWLKHDETKSTIADISPPGYSFFHEPRADQGAGGDVGILVSDQLKTDIHPLPSFKTFEAISRRIGNNSFSGFVVCHGTCFDLKQRVNLPTVHGHWLDLLITKRISNSIKSVFFGSRYLEPSRGHIRN